MMTSTRSDRASRSQRLPWPVASLFVVFTIGAILLACTRPCFALDIQPPAENEDDDFIAELESRGTKDWGSDEYYPNHVEIAEKLYEPVTWIDTTGNEHFQVFYYLVYGYTFTRTQKDDSGETIYYTVARVDAKYWSGEVISGEELIPTHGYGDVLHAAIPQEQQFSSEEEAVGALVGMMQGCIDSFYEEGFQDGWPVVPYGTAIPPEGSEGSKIPGPGSWWQWLTGTVIAGTVASLASLLNLFLSGAAPPAPTSSTTYPVKPTSPPAAAAPPKEYMFGSREADMMMTAQIENQLWVIRHFEKLSRDPVNYVPEKTGDPGMKRKGITDKDKIPTELEICKDALRRTAKDIENIALLPGRKAEEAWEKVKEYLKLKERLDIIKEEVGIVKDAMEMTKDDIDRLMQLPGEKAAEGLKKAGDALDEGYKKVLDNLFKPPQEGQ